MNNTSIMGIWYLAHEKMIVERQENYKRKFNQDEYDTMQDKHAKIRGNWDRLKIAANKSEEVQLKFIDFLGGVIPNVN